MPVGANAGLAGLNVNVGVNLQQFNAGMDQVEQRGAKAASSLNTLGNALTTGAGIGVGFAAAGAALSAVSGAAQAAGSAIIGLNSQLEQARIGFTAMTGSAEKSNNFIKQLQDFAAKTTFEFPGLLQASRQLMGMGVQAELVIPILKDVSTAVMRVGGNDTSITAVNRALTQMMATGKVMAGDMNQLAQAGLPAWKMLADSMGMTIGQVRKLSEEGKISADQMLEAFHKFANENGMSELLTKSAQTWQASTSNIIDSLRNIGAEGFEPLFNVMRDFAAQLAAAMTTTDFKNFGQDIKATVQEIIDAARPLGESLGRAFEAFKTDGISGAFRSILTDVQALATQMGGAGFTLVQEFASGIINGAASVVTEAANFVADIIASFLIGNSPPPVGPLSAIAQGGANVIAAYVDGMRTGATGVADVAQTIVDAMGNVDGAMTLSAGRAALQAAGSDMKALQAAVEDAEGVLRGLDTQIKDNQSALRDYSNAATDIKDAFSAAIDPLQQQVDALREVNDLTQKQADIQSKMALAQLKGQLAAAQGDPIKRAQLTSQLDTLEQQEKELTLAERALSLQNQSANLAAKARGEKVSTTQGQQAENALAQRRLALQQQQNAIQQQLNGMVDKEAVARIKSQQAQVQAVKDQRDINTEVANLQRELAAAPIEAQIKELKNQQAALLAPINERIEATRREGQELQERRKDWQDIKSAVMDVMQAQRAAAAEAKADATAATKAAKEAALSKPSNLAGIFTPEAITDAGTRAGQSMLGGMRAYLDANAGNLIAGAIGAAVGGAAFGPLGAVAGAAFGVDFLAAIQAKVPDIGTILGDAFRTAQQAFAGDWSLPDPETWINPFVAKIGLAFSRLGEIIRTAQGGDIQGAIIMALGDVGALAARILEWLGSAVAGIDWSAVWATAKPVLSSMADWFVDVGTQFATWIGAQVAAIDWAAIWAQATTVASSLSESLSASVQQIQWADIWASITTAATELTNAIKTWAMSVDWPAVWDSTGESVRAGMEALSRSLVAGVSAIDGKAFGDALGRGLAVGIAVAVQLLVDGIVGAFQGGIATLPNKLVTVFRDVVVGFVTGLVDMFRPAITTLGTTVGSLFETAATGILAGLDTGIKQSAPEIISAAMTLISNLLLTTFKSLLGISSPSTVFLAFGVNIVQGLADGITSTSALAVDALTTMLAEMLAVVTAGLTAIHAGMTTQLAEILALIVLNGATYVVATTEYMALMLVESTTGLTAIHTGMTTQLAEILVLITMNGETYVEAVTVYMAAMLEASTAGMSALHAGMTTQLQQIHAVVLSSGTAIVGAWKLTMDQSLTVVTSSTEQFKQAGLALGNAVAEGVLMAQSAMQRNMTTLMSAGGGGAGAQLMSTGGSGAPPQVQAAIDKAAAKYGLDSKIFTAQLKQESGFNPAAKGRSGEIGVGQFMPSTLMPRLQKAGITLDQYLSDINIQIEMSAQMMAELVQTYGDIDKALQAYNGGPGGVGSAATQHYSSIIRQSAASLSATPVAGATPTLMSGRSGAAGGIDVRRMTLGIDQTVAGANAGLTYDEAQSICGPYAAVLFAQATGRNPSLAEAKQLATKVGWSAAKGMGGVNNFQALLGTMGINAVTKTAEQGAGNNAATASTINQSLAGGNPVAISTGRHYFVARGGTAEGGLDVGATGTTLGRSGGKATMTLAEINSVGDGINGLTVLIGQMQEKGTVAFNTLTSVSGQMGEKIDTAANQLTLDVKTVSTDGITSVHQVQVATDTLAASIQSGMVPAGLAAKDAVGQMAIGAQPLIAAWAASAMTSDQLGTSIVQLAASSGLATAPLAALQAGNVGVGEAMRLVLSSLAATDPAFAAIQQSISGAQLTTEQFADVLLRGLGNVTGTVGPSLAQMATSVAPLQTAFSTGAISGEQLVQSVVQLGATSGLTQAPLRLMQDGVITANQALAMVLGTVSETNPELAALGESVAALPAPATEAATAFLEWIKSLQETQAATTTATEAVATVPEAVADIEAPMADASTAALQTLPTATTEALDQTVAAIQNISGAAAEAARAVGEAIVESLRATVEAGAESIAEAAKAIVEKALEQARAAASKVKEGAKGDGDKGGKSDDVDEKAMGGRLNAGRWTLVGEEGPELISPSGYVHTASETTDMLLSGINSGLFTLNKYAKGGSTKSASSSKSKSKSSSSKKSKDSGSGANDTTAAEDTKPKKPDPTPKSAEELDLEANILGIELERAKVLNSAAPIEAQILLYENELKKTLAGTFDDQRNILRMKKMSLEYEQASLQIQAEIFPLQYQMSELQYQQTQAGKGDLASRLKNADLNMQTLKNNQRIAEVQLESAPVRRALADIDERIADAQRGSLGDQIKSAQLTAQQHTIQQQQLEMQMKAAVLQQEISDTEASVNKILAGTAEQRAVIADNTRQTLDLDLKTLRNQSKLLPIQTQMRKIQEQIDDVQRGTLEDQYAGLDNTRENARLRLQEINIQSQLRNIEAGKLQMSQSEINALHEQLEAITLQKSDLSDQTEIRTLNATIATTDAQKQLLSLGEQALVHERVASDLSDQHGILENQTAEINTQNQVSAAGQQAKLLELQTQMTEYQGQITKLQSQNDILGLQLTAIQTANSIRADALTQEELMLQGQVRQYDSIIARVQDENNKISLQAGIIAGANAVAAAGYDAQILQLGAILERRQRDIDKLEEAKKQIGIHTGLITTQNEIAATGHEARLLALNEQKFVQDQLIVGMNSQLGTLNAQLEVYKKIREQADAIANRPIAPPPAGGPAAPGGPPGTVAATATKGGAQTLYLSRGTGTDGWYTSSGQLIAAGGNASPPSGYSVKWLAEGGTWHKGEVAVLGEEGPEIAIAPRDLHVFPHDRSASIARAFGKASSVDDTGTGERNNVTVNVQYHRHGGTEYGEATLQQVVREAIAVAMRS